MALLRFPILFTEEEYEKAENLGLDPKTKKGWVVINTVTICAYNEMDNGNVLVRMANGECYEIPLLVKDFEKILKDIESMVELTTIGGN